MTAKYDSDFANIQSYLKPADISGGMFHGTSSEFSTVSPSHATGFDNMYGNHVSTLLRNAYPVQYPVTAVAMGLDMAGLYETQVCRRKKSTGDKLVPPNVNLVPPTGSESSLAADIPRQESGTDEGDRRGVDGAARATQRTDSIVPDAPSGVRHGEAGACNAPN
ncbi:hypothetical protein V502_03475 [Pseudogymnoascus sp. VKM F-4520 (FW-2644)]|nr:hypothetical protein V502_03475 [Pseudogymnoascus sp. VKM F-4520 (FW-2644)]